MHITVKGLVLRETDFSEHDRYLTVLTAEGRKIEVLCRGVRRKGSRTANAVRLFCYTEFILYEGRRQYTLNDASLITGFWEITQDVERYAVACYMAELTNLLVIEQEVNPQAAQLCLYGLHALCQAKQPISLIKAAFELRLLAVCGFAPQVSVCGGCGRVLEAESCFSVSEGVMVCYDCAKRIGGSWIPVRAGVLKAIQFILCCEIRKVFSFGLGQQSLQQLAQLCEKYTLYQMEKEPESLKFYRSLQNPMQISKSGVKNE